MGNTVLAQARKKTDTAISFNVTRHVRQGVRESGFLLLTGIALYLLIALISFNAEDPGWTYASGAATVTNLGGVAGAWLADILLYFFGYFAYFFPLGLALGSWRLFRRHALSQLDIEIVVFRSLGFLVVLAAGCGLASLHLYPAPGTGSAGGIIGDMTSQGLVSAFSFVGGSLFLLALFLAGITLATGLSWLALLESTGQLTLKLMTGIARLVKAVRAWGSRPAALRSSPLPAASSSAREQKKPPVPAARPPERTRASVQPPGETPRSARIEPVMRVSLEDPPGKEEPRAMTNDTPATPKSLAPITALRPAAPGVSPTGSGKAAAVQDPLPPLKLLDRVPTDQTGYSTAALEDMARQVEILLRHFGIEVQVVAIAPGPVITRFELEPAPGVKVSQISNLSKDLARGLSVISVRVVEVIPGKSVVGLEIPNQHREIVYLSEILDSPVYAMSTSPMTLALGKDIGGNPVVANLARMPHLLVAGTTGSGKSVAINAMLLSMLYKARPTEVRLILVDPKMLELSIYEDIPHLLAPVVTDMKEAANALRWCVGEMERRYRLMAALKVRNITGFNRKVSDAIAADRPIPDPLYKPEDQYLGEDFESPPTLEPLPFIVVVIDELADMMMIVGKKVEELIARLAQKARASGIHLILATQRPSVDVITGLIKANIPTRIAFQVSSKVDSRTILDQMGAEQLLGHGDMLYLPPGTGLPQRVHGAFVDDHEVHQVGEYLRQTGKPDYLDDVLEEPLEMAGGLLGDSGGGVGEGDDPLYDQAVRIVTETRKASISGVQRRLKIGYNRAARMLEEMESAGVVGALQPNGSREVLAPPPPDA